MTTTEASPTSQPIDRVASNHRDRAPMNNRLHHGEQVRATSNHHDCAPMNKRSHHGEHQQLHELCDFNNSTSPRVTPVRQLHESMSSTSSTTLRVHEFDNFTSYASFASSTIQLHATTNNNLQQNDIAPLQPPRLQQTG